MKTIYSALNNAFSPFNKWLIHKVVQTPDDLTDTNSILLLHGGSDISPDYYNEIPVKESQAGVYPSERDKSEWALIQEAIKKGIPIFGICRGAQFLCIAADGKLWQDTTRHTHGNHPVLTKDGLVFESNSCHHQMMRLENTEHELIGWAPGISSHYKNEDGTIERKADQPETHIQEPEVVWFPKIKGFAVQGHPEWFSEYHPYVQWLRSELFKRIL